MNVYPEEEKRKKLRVPIRWNCVNINTQFCEEELSLFLEEKTNKEEEKNEKEDKRGMTYR